MAYAALMRNAVQRSCCAFCEAVQKGADIMDDTMFLNVLKTTVENHGCTIIDVDLENHIVNLDGPDDAVAACARAISDLVSG